MKKPKLLIFLLELSLGLLVLSVPLYVIAITLNIVQFSRTTFGAIFIFFLIALYAIGSITYEEE